MKLIWEVPIPAELNRERQVQVGDQTIWAVLGPLDVPREVIVTRQNKCVELELHYSAPIREPRKTAKSGDVRITTGVATGRVLCIEYSESIGASELKNILALMKSSVETDGAQQPQRRIGHYELIADDVLPWVDEQLRHEIMLEAR